MDLRQLRYFVGIVQAGSLSRAADHLHVAQSAISHHLAILESELEQELVTRGPKGIVLTEAGSILYRHAEAILRHVEFAKRDAMSALNVPSGRVSIGFPITLARILSYELFTRVRDAYPQILLHSPMATVALLRERLVNGRLDIAVLFAEPTRARPCGRAATLGGTLLCDGGPGYFAHPDCRCSATSADRARSRRRQPTRHPGSVRETWADCHADCRNRHIEHASPRHCIRYRQCDPAMVVRYTMAKEKLR